MGGGEEEKRQWGGGERMRGGGTCSGRSVIEMCACVCVCLSPTQITKTTKKTG